MKNLTGPQIVPKKKTDKKISIIDKACVKAKSTFHFSLEKCFVPQILITHPFMYVVLRK
jgi:hypothetical protein